MVYIPCCARRRWRACTPLCLLAAAHGELARGICSWPSSSCRPSTAPATHSAQADEGAKAARARSSKAQETSCIASRSANAWLTAALRRIQSRPRPPWLFEEAAHEHTSLFEKRAAQVAAWRGLLPDGHERPVHEKGPGRLASCCVKQPLVHDGMDTRQTRTDSLFESTSCLRRGLGIPRAAAREHLRLCATPRRCA